MEERNYLRVELYDRLHNDDRFFDFLQAGSLDGLWYWDLDDRHNQWISLEFWALLGYKPSDKEHTPSEWQSLIVENDLPKVMSNLESHMSNPAHPFDLILRFRHRSGKLIWTRSRGIAFNHNDDEAPNRMFVAHTDLSAFIGSSEVIAAMSMQIEALKMQVETRVMQIDILEQRNKELKQKLERCT